MSSGILGMFGYGALQGNRLNSTGSQPHTSSRPTSRNVGMGLSPTLYGFQAMHTYRNRNSILAPMPDSLSRNVRTSSELYCFPFPVRVLPFAYTSWNSMPSLLVRQ
jgi:hypothetical protein